MTTRKGTAVHVVSHYYASQLASYGIDMSVLWLCRVTEFRKINTTVWLLTILSQYYLLRQFLVCEPLVNLAQASVRGPTTWHASVRVARKSRALSRTRNSLRSPTTPTSTTSRLGLQFGEDTHRNCRDAYVPVVQTFASVLT